MLPVNPSAKTLLGRLPVRIYLIAACLVGVLLASYFLFVQPRNRAMAEAREEIRNRQATLQVLAVEMTRLDTARQRVDQLQKAVGSFEGRLPKKGEIDVILREVWVIADAAGLKTQRIKTLKDRAQDSYKVQPIEMNLRGPFAGIYSFLASLERLPGTMKVTSLKVTSTPNEENGCVDASIVLDVFCKE
jgi:type IV pilus assembly protein PilO